MEYYIVNISADGMINTEIFISSRNAIDYTIEQFFTSEDGEHAYINYTNNVVEKNDYPYNKVLSKEELIDFYKKDTKNLLKTKKT